MEELYESEVMWPDNGTSFRSWRAEGRHAGSSGSGSSMARPVKIPTKSTERSGGGGIEEEEVEAGKVVAAASWKEIVPPHVMVSRRRTEGEVAFSLCSGHGRTLKGRDLSYLRNSVLRMTGFIES